MAKEVREILLMGNPNTGKSVIFSRLTGARVTVSNYPGTTVGFAQGYMKFKSGEPGMIIDVPGVYNLEPLCKADDVACDMLEKGDMIINIVDATNLERNLYLTLELREKGIPMVVALNMWDETKHRGVEIDVKKLEKEIKRKKTDGSLEARKEATNTLANAVKSFIQRKDAPPQ